MRITAEFEHMYAGEHHARTLRVEPDTADLDKQLRLAFRTPAGQLFMSETLSPQDGYCTYILPQALLDAKGILEVQLHVKDTDGYYAKSAVYPFEVERSICGSAVPDRGNMVAIADLCADVREVQARIASITEIPAELVAAALEELERQVDTALSSQSANPVENRVITAALAGKANKTDAVITNSFSMGRLAATTRGERSVAAGYENEASGYASQAFGAGTTASAGSAHAEGSSTVAAGAAAHVEGQSTTASGARSHAEGYGANASNDSAHAEGKNTIASGLASHAQGEDATASGRAAHAEGTDTVASAEDAHAEGYQTAASGIAAHAEGFQTAASGVGSHAEGTGTAACGASQSARGKYNVRDTNGVYAEIVGNGTADNARSNAATVDWNGNGWFAGGVKIGGTGYGDANAKALATAEAVAAKADASSLAAVATSGAYADLTGKPTIPTVPANVSAFTNDAGYLTAHQSLSGLASETWVAAQVNAAKQAVKDRFIVTATWNSATGMVTAVDIPPAQWDLQNEAKTLVLRLTDGVRTVDMTAVTHTAFIAQRRLFTGLLPSTSVMGNDNVIVDESEHAPIPVYCFLGYDDQDPSSNTNVFVAGQRSDSYYVWISKLYRVSPAADRVVAQGQTVQTNGTWRWRKWESGLAECWASNYSFLSDSWSAYGNNTGFSYSFADFSLPFSMAGTDYTVSSVRSSGAVFSVIACAHNSASSFRIAYAMPTSSTRELTLYTDLHVVGRWK